MIDNRFDLGITLSQAVAAFAGSVTQVVIFPPSSKAWALIMILCGTLAAAFLSPLVVHLLGHLLPLTEQPVPLMNAVVFLTGSFGMMVLSVVGRVIWAVREDPEVVIRWWRQWRGGPPVR